jgi:hypothetical protein
MASIEVHASLKRPLLNASRFGRLNPRLKCSAWSPANGAGESVAARLGNRPACRVACWKGIDVVGVDVRTPCPMIGVPLGLSDEQHLRNDRPPRASRIRVADASRCLRGWLFWGCVSANCAR